MRKFAIISILSLCLGACVPGHNDYSEFANLPAKGWAYSHPVTFIPTVADSICHGTMVLTIRHGNAYPYRNLWLEFSHIGADSLMRHDTLNVELADIYGRWHGSGLGTSFQYSDTISTDFVLYRDAGLKVRHIMRTDTLPSVEQIGLSFTSRENQ